MVFKVSLVLFLLFPVSTQAAVTISEIAWMGDSVSANNEWIELYNDDSATINVDGWSISDGVNLDIDLSGSISGESYVVLERTDDDSAAGVAFLIYTGALGNSGATLSLTRDDGGIEDQVSGGENWENIGGDNTTKETAQYTTSGWVTSEATPGSENIFSDDDEEKDSESTAGGELQKGVIYESVKLGDSSSDLQLTINGPVTAYVHQPVNFTVEPTGLGKVAMDSLNYQWNLGDLTELSGQEVVHSYQYPGSYVVVVSGQYSDFSNTSRHTVTVLPVKLSLSFVGDGLNIHNNSPYEVDISGYQLLGKTKRIIPSNTVILPRSTITIPDSSIVTALADQSGFLVAAVNRLESAEKHISNVTQVSTLTASPDTTDFNFQTASVVEATDPEVVVAEDNEQVGQGLTPIPAADGNAPDNYLAYLGLLGVMVIGVVGVFSKLDQQ